MLEVLTLTDAQALMGIAEICHRLQLTRLMELISLVGNSGACWIALGGLLLLFRRTRWLDALSRPFVAYYRRPVKGSSGSSTALLGLYAFLYYALPSFALVPLWAYDRRFCCCGRFAIFGMSLGMGGDCCRAFDGVKPNGPFCSLPHGCHGRHRGGLGECLCRCMGSSSLATRSPKSHE